MARRKISHQTPPLPKGVGFKSKQNKGLQLLHILREHALKYRSREPQAFYPIRDLSRHFKVPVSTVARVYDELEAEGILVSVRGSRTLLQGSSSGRHLSVLGLVGMPALTPAFVTLHDYRAFFIRMRRELRARGFAVATVFYNQAQLRQCNRLVEQMEKQDFDIVLWYEPNREARETISRLRDRGTQVIGISDRFPASIHCRYEVRREAAILSILQDWRSRAEINSVIVIASEQGSVETVESFEALAAEKQLSCEVMRPTRQNVGNFLDSIPIGKDQAVIFPGRAAALFTFRAPDSLARLISRGRVAFIGGGISIPFAKIPDVNADFVVVDWQLLAEQIVTDLITRKAYDRAKTTVFEASAFLAAPLAHYAEIL